MRHIFAWKSVEKCAELPHAMGKFTLLLLFTLSFGLVAPELSALPVRQALQLVPASAVKCRDGMATIYFALVGRPNGVLQTLNEFDRVPRTADGLIAPESLETAMISITRLEPGIGSLALLRPQRRDETRSRIYEAMALINRSFEYAEASGVNIDPLQRELFVGRSTFISAALHNVRSGLQRRQVVESDADE